MSDKPIKVKDCTDEKPCDNCRLGPFVSLQCEAVKPVPGQAGVMTQCQIMVMAFRDNPPTRVLCYKCRNSLAPGEQWFSVKMDVSKIVGGSPT